MMITMRRKASGLNEMHDLSNEDERMSFNNSSTTKEAKKWKLIDALRKRKKKRIHEATIASTQFAEDNEQQQKEETPDDSSDVRIWNEYIVCPKTDIYRNLAAKCFDDEFIDHCRILEIGCCNGQTTEVWLKQNTIHPSNILAVDISTQFILQCQEKFVGSEVQFERINVLLEWSRLEEIIQNKWGFDYYLEQEQQELVVFIDIGGNREIESLVAIIRVLLSFATRRQQQEQCSSTSYCSLLTKHPNSIIVKSQALYDYGIKEGLNDWEALQNMARSKVIQRRKSKNKATVGKSEEDREEAQDERTNSREADPSTKPRKHRHPLKMPQRYTKEGIGICRFHNYDMKNGCLLFKDTKQLGKGCKLDHQHCHYCLDSTGRHVAHNCPQRRIDYNNTGSDESLLEAIL